MSIAFPGNISFSGTVSAPLFVSNQQIIAPVAAGTASTLTLASLSSVYGSLTQAYFGTSTGAYASLSLLYTSTHTSGSLGAILSNVSSVASISTMTASTGTIGSVTFGSYVGINTANPAFNLDVNGSARFTGSMTGTYASLSGGSLGLLTAGSYIGINNTSPSYTLDCSGSARVSGTILGTFLQLLSGNNNNGTVSGTVLSQLQMQYFAGGYNHMIKTRHNSNSAAGNSIDFVLWNYGTDSVNTSPPTKYAMTVDGVGIGINNTTPSYSLDVAGSARMTGSLTTALITVPKRIAWTTIPYGSSTAFGSGYGTPQYCLDELGYVRLRGLLGSCAVGSTIFTLPSACCPLSVPTLTSPGTGLIFAVYANDLPAEIRISTAGACNFCESQSTSSNQWVSLDNICYWPGLT